MADNSDDESVGASPNTSRRTFLKATGAATGAAAVGSGANSAVAQSNGVDIKGLIADMTLEQKVGQMTKVALGTFDPSASTPESAPSVATIGEYFSDLEVGAVLTGGASPPSFDPETVADGIETIQEYAVENSSHGVPLLWGADAVHGNDLVAGATVLPQRINMGATRDIELIETAERHTGQSVAGVGWNWNYAPTTDLQRDPRWSRFYEGVSESPKLLGEVSKARIRGFQSQDGCCSCLKHFGAYSVPDTGNDRGAATTSLRDLRQQLLPPYRMALDEEPATVMLNSGSVNGVPAHASDWLVGRMLRDRYGFDGVVTTDYNDFRRVASNNGLVPETEAGYRRAIELGINAGIDMYMIGNGSTPLGPGLFIDLLVGLVEDGEVPESRIDESVGRILELKVDLGLFEDPMPARDTSHVGGGQDASKELARESMVLLKNDAPSGGSEPALPLSGDESVLLAGPGTDTYSGADSRFLLQHGGWTLGWQGVQDGYPSPDGPRPRQTTISEALSNRFGASNVTDVRTDFTADPYNPDTSDPNGSFEMTDAQESTIRSEAASADAVVVVLGEGPHNEGFGDRDYLHLDPAQQAMVTAVREAVSAGTPVVGVVLAGSPRGTAETFDRLDAVVFAGQPGSDAGTAVAETLVGDYSPSGRLAFQWPQSVGRVPNHHNAKEPLDQHEPLYSIGHGLSYTDFEYSDVSLSSASVADPAATETVTLSVDVTNTGDVAGDHVLDVFNTEAFGEVMHPAQRLVGFTRLDDMSAGETRTAEIEIDLAALEVVPGDILGVQPKVVEGIDYELTVGPSGPSTTLTVEETASVTDPDPVPGQSGTSPDGDVSGRSPTDSDGPRRSSRGTPTSESGPGFTATGTAIAGLLGIEFGRRRSSGSDDTGPGQDDSTRQAPDDSS